MATQGSGHTAGSGAGDWGGPPTGGVTGALVAFDHAAGRAAAMVIREAGERTRRQADGLVAALDAASAAAGGLVCGPALAECADLLARRARALAEETVGTADGMDLALGALVGADEEVARRVAGAAG